MQGGISNEINIKMNRNNALYCERIEVKSEIRSLKIYFWNFTLLLQTK